MSREIKFVKPPNNKRF